MDEPEKNTDFAQIRVKKEDLERFKGLFAFLAAKNKIPIGLLEKLTHADYFGYLMDLVDKGREGEHGQKAN